MESNPEAADNSLIYRFHKDRLPRSHSYPLKRSLLDAALEDCLVAEAVVRVYYCFRPKVGATVMEATFYPEGQQHVFNPGKNVISLFAVPSEQRQTIEFALVTEGIPRMCNWFRAQDQAGNVWRGSRHEISFRIHDGILTVVEE